MRVWTHGGSGGGGGGVTSFSAGTTGLLPSSPTTGAVVLSGTLASADGGTDNNSYTIGDILYASAATTLSKLSDVATGNALISGGVGVAPSYGKISLTAAVSGTLPVANGGTGQSSYTDGQLLIGDTSTTGLDVATLTAGTAISIANGHGSITITNAGVTSFSAGTTGLTPNSASTGAVTLAGTLATANGGTGQTTYTDGQLLIGDSSTNKLDKATLTAGSNITITNGNGSITIAASGSGSYTFVTKVAITAVTHIDFTSLAAGYDYIFSVRGACPHTTADYFCARFSQSGVFDTSAHYFSYGNSGLVSAFFLTANVQAADVSYGLYAECIVDNPGETGINKGMICPIASQPSAGGSTNAVSTGGLFNPGNTNAVDGVRFYWNGNESFVAQGYIVMYQRKNS